MAAKRGNFPKIFKEGAFYYVQKSRFNLQRVRTGAGRQGYLNAINLIRGRR